MDNQLLVSLSEKYGSPLYVYDAEKIISQYNRIINAFSSVKSLKLNYAVKANSNVSILKLFKKLNSGIDTVSIQEVKLGLYAGFEPSQIIYTPNGVSMEEIEKVENALKKIFGLLAVCLGEAGNEIIRKKQLIISFLLSHASNEIHDFSPRPCGVKPSLASFCGVGFFQDRNISEFT